MPQIDFEELTKDIERFTPPWFDEFTKVSALVNKAEEENKLIDIYAGSGTIDLIQYVVTDRIGGLTADERTNKLVYALRALDRLGYVIDYTRSYSISLKAPRLYRNDPYTTFYWKDHDCSSRFEVYISVPTGIAWSLISLAYKNLRTSKHNVYIKGASTHRKGDAKNATDMVYRL